MTAEELKQLKHTIVAHAAYYQKPITEQALELMVEDLKDLPLAELLDAFRVYRNNPRNRSTPLPADLRAIVHPKSNQLEDDMDAARDVASRIIEAVARCGAYNAAGAERMVGEIGWAVINRYGGWSSLCTELNNLPMYFAQLRDLSLSLVRRHRNGELHTLPGFDKAKELDTPRNANMIQIGNIFRKLT
jgi:hypothetical protein